MTLTSLRGCDSFFSVDFFHCLLINDLNFEKAEQCHYG